MALNNPPSAGFDSQVDQTANRAIDGTVYRNTSGKTRLVVITITATLFVFQSFIRALSDSLANPTTTIAMSGGTTAATAYYSISFLVLPLNYYKANTNGNGETLQNWIEYT